MAWEARVQRNAGPAQRKEKNPENGENSHHSQFASLRLDIIGVSTARVWLPPIAFPTLSCIHRLGSLGNRTRVAAEVGPKPTQSRKEEYTLWAQVLTKARSSLEEPTHIVSPWRS